MNDILNQRQVGARKSPAPTRFGMKTKGAALIGLGMALLSSPVLAQEAEPFAGTRIAVTGGWDRIDHDGQNGSGFNYGGTIGYDLAFGAVRLGPEAEVTDSTQKSCFKQITGERCEDAGRDLYVGGRLGYAMGDKVLLYTRVGYTNGRFTERFRPGTGATPAMPAAVHDNRSGVRAGVGLEYAVTPSIFLTSEYRYSNYSGDFSRNQVVGGVGIRF